MATADEMRALMSVACPWCGAKPGVKCFVRMRNRRSVPSTLDGEAHDARWQRALGVDARVLSSQVEKITGRDQVRTPDPVPVGAVVGEPVLVGAALEDRPW